MSGVGPEDRCQRTDVRGQMSEDRRQMTEDPSSLFELGASPFGLRPHKTPRHARLRSSSLGLRPSGYDPTRRRGRQKTDIGMRGLTSSL